MKNTSKLKLLLQLYTISLDMEEEEFYLTLVSKTGGSSATFVDSKYTTVIGKAFRFMVKEMKEKEKKAG